MRTAVFSILSLLVAQVLPLTARAVDPDDPDRPEARFERLHGQGISFADGATARIVDGKWILYQDSAKLMIILKAVNNPRYSLSIRCADNLATMIIDANQYLGPNSHEFAYIIDQEPQAQAQCRPARDARSLFIHKPVSFLRKLDGKNTLTLRLNPPDQPGLEAIFDIQGLAAILEPIEQACNWQLKQ